MKDGSVLSCSGSGNPCTLMNTPAPLQDQRSVWTKVKLLQEGAPGDA